MSSASTPSPSSTSPGKCVVCGRETWMRCSACSSAGLDWMCFCSIEHQRILWPIHKRVCGERSNPFQWPILSDEEIDEIVCSAKLALKGADDTEARCWLDVFKSFTDSDSCADGDDLVKLRRSLEVDHRDTDLGPLMRQAAHTARLAILKEEGKDSIEATATASVENPFNHLVYVEEAIFEGFPTQGKKYDLWTGFQHRYLHLLAVARYGHMHSDMVQTGVLKIVNFIKYTVEELKRFVHEDVTRTHPKEARLLRLLLSRP